FCIDEFNVVPNQQRLGIGKKLISFVSDVMKRDNINNIFLVTGGELATKFYEKNGFIKTNDGIMMELEL
ncbi:N-acetyltransferase, partial [Staphylococcus cohnii]